MFRVSGNSAVLLFQTKVMLQKKSIFQTFHSKQHFISNAQWKWELLKYKIPKFTIKKPAKVSKEKWDTVREQAKRSRS